MKLFRKIVHFYRNVYNYFYSKKIHNVPSIISRDCIGGVLYSDYNLKFMSPTINLEFDNEDFIVFCNYLQDYLKSEIIEVKNSQLNYPLGKIVNKHGKIYVHFRHYNSFENAKKAWNRRKKRVDYNNIYIIMCIGPNGNEKIVQNFEKIPYKHKILLSSNVDLDKYHNCFNMKCYNQGYKDSLIQHKTKYSIRRYYDEFNWINFLNNKE